MSRQKRLEHAIAKAKSSLGDSEFRTAEFRSSPSTTTQTLRQTKLQKLLGKEASNEERHSLFSRQGVTQRPTFETISSRRVGDVNEYQNPFLKSSNRSSSDHIAHRLNSMREQRLQSIAAQESIQAEPHSTEINSFAPAWMSVLEEQRSMSSHPSHTISQTSQFIRRSPVPQFRWPRKVQWSERQSFRQWFVSSENMEATHLMEAIIDEPTSTMNPVTIVGGEQTGTTFLLRATGQALLRRQEGHILWFNGLDLNHSNDTPIEDAIEHCLAILIDDVEAFAQHEQWNVMMGEWIEHALNNGIQVIASTKIHLDDLPSSKMRRLLNDGISCEIMAPTEHSLVNYAHWHAQHRNLILTELELIHLVRASNHSWRSVRNSIEQLAHEQHREQKELYSNFSKIKSDVSPEHLDDLSNEIISKAVDTVHTGFDIGGVELFNEIPEWEDDYTPPEFENLAVKDVPLSQIEDDVQQLIEKVNPTSPSVLDVHDEDKFIVSKEKFANVDDISTTVEILVDIDERMDRAILSRDERMSEEKSILEIEQSMEALNQRIQHADLEELITIADELKIIDGELNAIQHGPEHGTEVDDLDSFNPENEWFIDQNDVSIEDLSQPDTEVQPEFEIADDIESPEDMFEEEEYVEKKGGNGIPKKMHWDLMLDNVVHLSTLKRKRIMMPIEDGEEE